MKAVSAELPTDDERWAYEVKWDGYRLLAFVDEGEVRLQSSNLLDVTGRYPELHGLPQAVGAGSAVIDGEIVGFDDDGRPRFVHVQRHDRALTYVVFDVLSVDGHDVTDRPYEERRALLEQLVTPGPGWMVPKYQVGGGRDLLEATERMGLEGIVAKRLGSPYQRGRRSPSWRKIKNRPRQELVVGGWTPGEGNRATSFASLLVGYHEDGALRYAGAVGTGFDQQALDDLLGRLLRLETDACPFATPSDAVARSARWREVVRHARWVRPELVCEVSFGEWTADAVLRHPSFEGLRFDKDAADVVREEPS
jgi:bifunctional non-homologous end joining protein LigD